MNQGIPIEIDKIIIYLPIMNENSEWNEGNSHYVLNSFSLYWKYPSK